MKLLTLKSPAVGVVLAAGAVASANAAMPLVPVGGYPSIVLVACAPGLYPGPWGICYEYGTGRRYYGGYYRHPGYYGAYYGHRAWYRGYDEYYRPPYRAYPDCWGPYRGGWGRQEYEDDGL